MKEIAVEPSWDGMKIEKFARKYLSEAPLGFIYRLFRKKDIKINGHWVPKDAVLHAGDVVRIYVSDQQLSDFQKPRAAMAHPFPHPILYEDGNVLIVDKPSGLLVYGDETEKRNTLARQVLDYLVFTGEFNPDTPAFVPSPAHRLDRNTSGIVAFGKSDAGLKALEELFKERTGITKKYWALLVGTPDRQGVIDAPLLKNPESGLVSVTPLAKGGKSAKTEYRLLESFGSCSLVEADLLTGRTHQLRVHFAFIKHPILGDGKYGDFEANRTFKAQYGLDHQFLHAHSIAFGALSGVLEPLSGRVFTSPLEADEEAIITKLRDQSPKE